MASPVEGDNVGWMVTNVGSLMLKGSTSTSTADGVLHISRLLQQKNQFED